MIYIIAMVFHFLFHLVDVLEAYFGKGFTEDNIRAKFTLVYEIFDEVLDYGYPQASGIDILKMVINLGDVQNPDAEPAADLTSQLTGAIDWRREGIYHRKNEVFIDVLESVNLLIGAQGNILRQEVNGKVVMKSFLSGMPECKFGLNDKLIMEGDGKKTKAKKKVKGVEIDDCTFHKCVKLSTFDSDRTITFIPPDGEFELMKYRVTENINMPIEIQPVYDESSKRSMMINIKATAAFDPKLFAQNVAIHIPVPPTTAVCTPKTIGGQAKYEPSEKAVVWRLRKFPGGTEYTLTIEVQLVSSAADKPWTSRAPISLEFQVPMFTSSGLYVRFLKVYEKSSYQTTKWVRYLTRAGEYQMRII